MINPNKFYERTKLFKDIIYEIFRVESNYRTELSILNLKLFKKIEEHKAKLKKLSKQELFRQSHKINNTENNIMHSSIKSNKSEDFILIEKEENSLLDILVSEGLQQLLNFYKGKHKLISKEVSSLGIILYNYTSQKTCEENEVNGINLEKNEIDFDINYNKLEIAKEKYFNKMNEIELFFHNEGQNIEDNKISNNNNNIKSHRKKIKQNLKMLKDKITFKDNGNIINDNENNEELETEKIKELKKYRQNYKKSLDEINNTKRTYISKVNEICNQIQEFNLLENNILYNIFKIFNENLIILIQDVDKYCAIYENNQKLIQNLNTEFSNNLLFNNKINKNYQFEEYNPKFSDMHNKKDLSVIQKMHKLIGFEFDTIIYNKDEDIFKEKDNNVLFIILMDKFINADKDNKLTDKEKYILKNLLNQEKYIDEFLNKLNVIRINKKLFYNKENFDILLEFFEFIYSKVSFSEEKNHEIVKLLMILSETFYYKDDNKKIFLNNVLKLPQELKDMKFWIRYIEIEIEIDIQKQNSNKNKKKKNNKFEYIVLLSNLTHLREYMNDKDKLKEIIDYFKEKYNFSVDDFDIIKGQLNL